MFLQRADLGALKVPLWKMDALAVMV